jgi:hypothetical protein
MGKLAMLGEFTCLAAAMLLLPAMIRTIQAREQVRQDQDQDQNHEAPLMGADAPLALQATKSNK